MFQSYESIKRLGKKDNKHTWEYELTDSEFGTVSGVGFLNKFVSGVKNIFTEMYEVAVIQEYSKRNLNVAANLVVAFVWYNKQNTFWSIQHMIDCNKKYNPLFPRYEKDLQKYLVLL
jgi:hypothetical protein